jgi:hypothetical protein
MAASCITERTRLAIDIGGTFTDLAIDNAGERATAKVLTTPAAPEEGVMNGVRTILATAGLAPSDISSSFTERPWRRMRSSNARAHGQLW